MKLKFICTLIAICILFSLSSCGSDENTFDIYHGYEVRVISPEGYDAIQIISLFNANDFWIIFLFCLAKIFAKN